MDTTQPTMAPAPVSQPAPTVNTISSPVQGEYRYAGFGVRLLAALIDGLIIGSVSAVAQMAVGDNQSIGALIGAAYYIGMWVKNDGMSIGKKVMKIKVIQTNGQSVDIKTAVLRYVGYMVSGLVLGLGFIMVAFDAKKQGWHDKIASTYVIYS